MSGEKPIRFEKDLEDALKERTPLGAALLLVKSMREVYGGEWVIDAKDGGFTIRRTA